MPTFITPSGYSGSAELNASSGLTVVYQGRWTFSLQGYNDGATFGLALNWPTQSSGSYASDYGPYSPPVHPQSGGLLNLTAENWTIPVIGNTLQSYTDPETSITYGPDRCRIQLVGKWQVYRQQNSNSYNSFNIQYIGTTETDQGGRSMDPDLLTYTSPNTAYVIQGSSVEGGARDSFSDHVFYVRVTEEATTSNSNGEFQSNTVTRPSWNYTYTMSWQID
jgi:hypothetical protein